MPKSAARNKQIATIMKMEPTIALEIADPPTTLAKANLLPIALHLVYWRYFQFLERQHGLA